MHAKRKTPDAGMIARSGTHAHVREARALIAGSIWLYLGFIGAAAFGAGLTMTLDNEANGDLTTAAIVGGGALAPCCWLRARAVLERAKREPVGTTDATIEAASPIIRIERHVRECVERAWTDDAEHSPQRPHRV